MRLPSMRQQENSAKRQIVAFGGLNLGASPQDGELSECKNLSSTQYPSLSQREAREKMQEYTEPTALFAKDKLCLVDGTSFMYDGKIVGDVSAGTKQIVSIGASVVVFPDKKYYNSATEVFGSLEQAYTSDAGKIKFESGTIVTTGEDFVGFRAGDAVEVSGCTVAAVNNKTAIVRAVENKKLIFYDNTFTAGDDTGAITIKRKVPELSCVCESNNRLWGCADGQIFGSKLGDPFNWYVYDGLSTDSYAVVVGSSGEFTGCIAYSSHIAFFKEDCVHKLYGNKPSNYQLQTSGIYGVEKGSSASLKIINETLFYKGQAGIYAYTGGVPELISANFGRMRFTESIAETDGDKYYISMRSGDKWGLYVYDVMRNLWHQEDDSHIVGFARYDGDLYFLRNKALYKMNSGSERIEWSATFCKFTEIIEERKCYSKLGARIELEQGAFFCIDMRTDGDRWKQIYTHHNERARTINVPIVPTRCDSFEIRFRGRGKCTVKYLARQLQFGSEV